MIDESLASSKKELLLRYLGKFNSLLVAFSGGVDSSFLLASAQQALGDRVAAVTATSSIHPRRERNEASKFTRGREINHIIFKSDEAKIPEFLSNGPDRCYHCKKALSKEFLRVAKEKAINHVAHGTNTDDLKDYRPGFRAAEEAGIIAPLIDAGLCKDEIRFLAKDMGLQEWDKPAMACLATRFPYGSTITEKGLKMVEEAEEYLLNEGFRNLRVRHHGPVARIEVSTSELKKIVDDDTRKVIVEKFRRIGFEHIALDLEGYISGKMNRGIEKDNPIDIDD